MLNVCIGILFGFIAGTHLPYNLVPKIFLPLPIIFFVLFIFFPETPQYFIARKNFDVRKNANKHSHKNIMCTNAKQYIRLFILNSHIQSLHQRQPHTKIHLSFFSLSLSRIFFLILLLESKKFAELLSWLSMQRTSTMHEYWCRIRGNIAIRTRIFRWEWKISKKYAQKHL